MSIASLFKTVCCGLLAAALFTGCGGKKDPPPPAPTTPAAPASGEQPDRRPATYDELVQIWTNLANTAPENFEIAKGVAIAENMAARGIEGIQPILDVLSDPDGSDKAKVFATINLQALVPGTLGGELVPRLIEFTNDTYSEATRRCAAHLVGTSIQPEALARTKELANDPVHSVRTAARLVLIHRGELAGLDAIMDLWNDPETTVEEREELIRAIPQHFAKDYLEVYNGVLKDDRIGPDTREGAVAALATIGNAESLELLHKVAESDPDPEIQEQAKGAAAVLAGQLGEAPPAEATPGEAPAEPGAP